VIYCIKSVVFPVSCLAVATSDVGADEDDEQLNTARDPSVATSVVCRNGAWFEASNRRTVCAQTYVKSRAASRVSSIPSQQHQLKLS
jgi:hypothetical protein